MDNIDNNEQSNVRTKKVDQRTYFSPGGEITATGLPAQRSSDGRFLPGNKISPGRQSLQELTKNFRYNLLTNNREKAAKIAEKWLESNDPFVQKLFFEYIVGKPKVQQESTSTGDNNLELMRSAMKAFGRLQELEAENAKMKAELESRTIDANVD